MTTTDLTPEVVIVGAGLAGLSAANRLAGLGLSVRVLEQSNDAAYLCNSRYTGGLFHIAMDDMAGDPAWVRENLERVTAGTTHPSLADALVNNAKRALYFLKSLGVRFIVAGPDGLRRNSLAPPGVRQTGLNWRFRSGDVMLRVLGAELSRRGGRIERGVRAMSLIMEDGRCVGLSAQFGGKETEIRASAVLIADGGFQGNLALVGRFISPRPDRLLQRNAQSGKGSGLLMAEAVGAALVGTDRFYGHLHHRNALTDPKLWPYPVVDSIATAAVVVNDRGQRFCDEGGGGVFICNEIARLANPASAFVVFDQATWHGPGRDWLLPANPYLITAGGSLIEGISVEQLATRMSIDPASLCATIANYNRYLSTGERPEDQPVRTTSRIKAWKVEKGPFYAIPLCAGITYTMGGIATNACTEVLNAADQQPIPGLYAAGAATGGLEGGGFAGYSGGLSKSAVFGMLAGEAIAVSLGVTARA